MKKIFQKFYIKYIRNSIKRELTRQRIKLIVWDIWGYYPLLITNKISFFKRINLIKKCVVIDWNILHAHKPCELAPVLISIFDKKLVNEDNTSPVVVEAGCWLGGSSAKFSLACSLAKYELHIYDSFAGVEFGDPSVAEAFFYGTYVGEEKTVQNNIKKYGDISVCEFHKGWFIDTFQNFNTTTKVVYIDCDLKKGTLEVITAVKPYLLNGGKIYTQDYHISSIKEALNDKSTWEKLNILPPIIKKLKRNTAVITYS